MTGVRKSVTLLLPTGTVWRKKIHRLALYCFVYLEAMFRNRENAMAYIRLPGGVKVALEYEVLGKIVVNVYHVTTTDPIITIKLFDIADLFEAWWRNSLSDNFSDEIALHTVTAQNLDVANGEKIVLAVSPAVPGAGVDTAVPNNVAIVATLNTAKTGRSFRGRSYLAGLERSELVGNNIGTGRAAGIVSDYAILTASLELENNTLVVASFYHDNQPRAEGVATPVESFSVNTRVDTQRRRLPEE